MKLYEEVHIDVGPLEDGSPIILLCGKVWEEVSATDDWWHVSDYALVLKQVTCDECLNHPDRALHELKFLKLED